LGDDIFAVYDKVTGLEFFKYREDVMNHLGNFV